MGKMGQVPLPTSNSELSTLFLLTLSYGTGCIVFLKEGQRWVLSRFAYKQLGISPSLPLDSVVWYGVYTFFERRDKHGDPLDWTSGTTLRGRGGNRAVLRARGLAGRTAAPCFWLSSVLGAGGPASPLYSTR